MPIDAATPMPSGHVHENGSSTVSSGNNEKSRSRLNSLSTPCATQIAAFSRVPSGETRIVGRMQPYQPMGPGQPGPYANPYANPYPQMPPSGPRTLGTLSIVFGAIVVAFSFFGVIGGGTGLSGMMLRGLPHSTGPSAMKDYLDAIQLPQVTTALVFLVMSIWLIVLGVGQRRYRAWAGRQSVLWGVIGLIALVGVFVMHLLVIAPATERMMAEIAHQTGKSNPIGSMAGVFAILGIAFYVPYPIILIVAFRKPAIAAAMRT